MKKNEWNLCDIYPSEKDLQKDWIFIKENIENLKSFEGKLNTEKNILDYIKLRDEIEKRFDKIYAIRYLKKDENVLDSNAIKKFQEVKTLEQSLDDALVFFESELLKQSQAFLDNLFINEPDLEAYRLELEDIIRLKAHLLSKEEEKILTAFSRPIESFKSTYEILINGDLKFDDAYDSKGVSHKVKMHNQKSLTSSSDRELRKHAFESMHTGIKNYVHTISNLYLSQVFSNSTKSSIRKYSSFMEESMENTNSSIAVYNSLIKTVNENLELHHRYFRLKKALLGLNEMQHYDKLAPILTKVSEQKYSYDTAKEMVLKALTPLGEEYTHILSNAFESNWAHVYPKENKCILSYSYDLYGVHPYICLNFNGTLQDVKTIAHEFGHAMHSYYSRDSQPYSTSDHYIMVSEVASTVNETLLLESLQKYEKDILKKANYLQLSIDSFNSTIIRQTMFAEFEKWVYEETEKGNNLTCEDLCEFYKNLNKKYFGEAIEDTDGIEYEWARIPHFFMPFYVYKYATGLSSAICIADNINSKGESYVEKYIQMLKMGTSIKPLDQLRSVDIDLESGEALSASFKYYERKIDEFERLLRKINK